MKLIIDAECDDLLDNVSKIHCISYREINKSGIYEDDPKSVTTKKDMRDLLESASMLVCHNIYGYDLRVFKKLLGYVPSKEVKIYDSLGLSWALFPDRDLHGLASWGEQFGVPKPPVEDWKNLSPEEYTHRCQEDVKINTKLWHTIGKQLKLLYGGTPEDLKEAVRFMDYISFKMKCAADQEELGWDVDLPLVVDTIEKLEALQEPKIEELKEVMPLNKKYKLKTKPKVMYKKDGTLSEHGKAWLETLKFEGVPLDSQTVKVLDKIESPNPNSSDQVKDWLFSLGWVPCTFDHKKDSQGNPKKIPQVRKDGELTDSVLRLSEKEPHVRVLEDLTVIQHRLGILKGFLENVTPDGKLRATIHGLTNTLRFKHNKPLVNLPGVDKPWGKEIRSCLKAPEGGILCGSDMSSLESTTKRHYMYPYDPTYVEEMSQEGFDEHLDLAKHAGELTEEDYHYYTKGIDKTSDRHKGIHKVRKKYKPVNYSSIYGIGPPKLAQDTGMTLKEANKLLEAYWKRNWSVRALSEAQKVKVVGKQRWLFNPVSGFWYSLRFDKDRFSTLNQSTGVYCFDTWLAFCKSKGVNICGQFHDEQANPLLPGESPEDHTKTLRWAIDKTNEKLKLNVKLDIDIKYGKNYAEVH